MDRMKYEVLKKPQRPSSLKMSTSATNLLAIPQTKPRQRSLSLDPKIVLNWAVMRNDLDTVMGVVDSQNVDINEAGIDGFYPLHRAATTGSLDCLRFLIARGANPNVLGNDGCSPLDVAVAEGEYDCALFLIKSGASISHIKDGLLMYGIPEIEKQKKKVKKT